MEEYNIVVCPNCGDTWVTDKEEIKHECLCFRCWYKYIPQKIIKIWDFVFNAIKNVKGV